MEWKVKFNSVEQVKIFIQKIEKREEEFDLIGSNHYIVDAKSIMGIFSLDLSKELVLKSYNFNANEAKSFEKEFEEFIRE